MANANLVQHFNLTEYCQKAHELFEGDDSDDDFVKFMLAGKLGDVQAIVSPSFNRLKPNDEIIKERDFDSLIGISDRIEFENALTLFPVARKQDTLTRSLHLNYTIMTPEGEGVPIHKIPNIALGNASTHSLIRVLIPGIYTKGRSSFLEQSEMANFYNYGLLPAIQTVLGSPAGEWPSSYTNEMFRARDTTNGYLKFQTKTIPHDAAAILAENIISALQSSPFPHYADGLAILHQIRGVKTSYKHDLEMPPGEALKNFLRSEHLSFERIKDSGEWWVDVGIEFADLGGQCLAWRTNAHTQIVEHVLNVETHIAKRITTPGSSKYHRDLTSHLTNVSGCRIEPGPRGQGRKKIEYLQLYTTDKSVLYHPVPELGKFGKFLTCTDIIENRWEDFLKSLWSVYYHAIDNNTALARLEVRVGLKEAANILFDLDDDLIRRSLYVIPSEDFWGLRLYRAAACSMVLDWQQQGPSKSRALEPAISLTMAISWLVNGLHSAPDSGQASRDLMDNVLPHVRRRSADPDILAYGTAWDSDDEDEDMEKDSDDDNEGGSSSDEATRGRPTTVVARPLPGVTVPAYPFGLVFLRDIRLGQKYPVPRLMSNGTFVTDKTFLYFFGYSQEDFTHRMFKSSASVPSHKNRIRNMIQRTTPIDDNALPPVTAPEPFDIPGNIPAPADDEGSDMEVDDRHEVAHDLEGPTGKAVWMIWRQCLKDIANKTPNRKRAEAGPYTVLTSAGLEKVGEHTYKNRNLAAYFDDCQFRHANAALWSLTFNHIFPERGSVIAGVQQNWLQCTYRRQWFSLIENENIPAAQIVEIRQKLKERFDTLYWMPSTEVARMWYTKRDAKLYKKRSAYPLGSAAPRVLINGGLEPYWDLEDRN